MADEQIEDEDAADADDLFEIIKEVTEPKTLAEKFVKLRAEIGDMRRLPLEAVLVFCDIESDLGIQRTYEDFERDIGSRLPLSPSQITDPEKVAELRRIERQSEKKSTTLNEYSRDVALMAATHPAISDQVKEVIKEDGWSLTALGELAKVDPAVLSRFMRGEGITVETLDRLCKSMLLLLQPDRPRIFYRAIVEDRRRKKPPK